MGPPGIRFNDCLFTEPTHLSDWTPPKYAGLFVILAHDANWAPKPYQPVYFGEFGNNTHEGLLPTNYAWLLGAESGAVLFISVLPMPFTTAVQRRELRNELLSAYNPISQTREVRAAVSELANRLAEVDRKPQQEQAAEVLVLLAGVNRLFGPQLEREPRRRIGFLP